MEYFDQPNIEQERTISEGFRWSRFEKGRGRHTWQPKARERLRRQSHADISPIRLLVNLRFPVVDLVQLWQRQVAHDVVPSSLLGRHARSVGKEGDLSAGLDVNGRVGFVVGFEGPGGDALFLDGEVLGEGDVGGNGGWRVLELPV
jgi:hypothetical protein